MEIKPLNLSDEDKQILIDLLNERKKTLSEYKEKIASFEMKILIDSFERITTKIQKSMTILKDDLSIAACLPGANLKRIENTTPIFDSDGSRINTSLPKIETPVGSLPKKETIILRGKSLTDAVQKYIVDSFDWCRIRDIVRHFDEVYDAHTIRFHLEKLEASGIVLSKKEGKFLEYKATKKATP